VVRHPWEIGRGEVSVRREVDEPKGNHKLSDLQSGDPFLPPDFDSPCALEVIPIHNDVDEKVERNYSP